MSWIKQKPENEPVRPDRAPAAAARPSAPAPPPQREPRSVDRPVNIGKSVQIKGDLTGHEDLTIEGKLEGKVLLQDHQLTIGANGSIKGEIRAKSVIVVGELNGSITADDKVEVSASGSMRGDIRAPRVVLVDGASFKGSVDMQERSTSSNLTATQPVPASAVKTAEQQAKMPEPELAAASK
jgi:cytoskeletal protein CcmA (bactofilin family)